ncbi:MAG: tRNA (adenosine(37)-N6)-threonylcarbamoyltransferase complex dimerization subunit type 1 TsaB, partial [Rhodovibrionaceae bacterium]|nr:tRNA (adenosine(37)-N6)-threonylcarbamoyltransferase complex dimerization subunit type 1 TsaB [Rhodovibrionaceae bacterium]
MSRPRRLLALDAAGTACSAAIVVDGRLVAARFESMRRGHSERLVPMIGEVMAEAGLAYADLDAVGVTRGPGAFTGVRIGLATARAIGLAAGKPIYGRAACFLHPAAAELLAGAVDLARPLGYRLRVFDAYRPTE